jgi:hypothetical protein
VSDARSYAVTAKFRRTTNQDHSRPPFGFRWMERIDIRGIVGHRRSNQSCNNLSVNRSLRGEPQMPIAVIIDWYGPYTSLESFRAVVKKDWTSVSKCIYMTYGRGNIANYVGLTSRPAGRFANHPNVESPDNIRYFIGEIITQGIFGRRSKKTKPDLDLAEHALICSLMPKFNVNRRYQNLTDCISIFSRFFDGSDYEKPINPLPKFPKLIAYNSWSEQWTVKRF